MYKAVDENKLFDPGSPLLVLERVVTVSFHGLNYFSLSSFSLLFCIRMMNLYSNTIQGKVENVEGLADNDLVFGG